MQKVQMLPIMKLIHSDSTGQKGNVGATGCKDCISEEYRQLPKAWKDVS